MTFRDDDFDDDFDDTLAHARVRAGLPPYHYAYDERDPEACRYCGQDGGGGFVIVGGEEVKCPRCGDE